LLDFETNKKKKRKGKRRKKKKNGFFFIKTVTQPLAVTSPHAKWGVQLK
jgi:hypothetical protein